MSLLLLFPSGGGAPSAITGTGAATETGNDTAASLGDVVVSGSGALVESGIDLAASSGDVLVQGTSSTAETGQDVANAIGTAQASIFGEANASETGIDSAVSSGAIQIQGTAALPDIRGDFVDAGGGVAPQGSGDATESGDDSALANGTASPTDNNADTHDGYFHKLWRKMAERQKEQAQSIEELEDRLDEVAEEIETVKSAPIPKQSIYIQSIPVPPFEEKAKLLNALIAERQRIINEINEEEDILLML